MPTSRGWTRGASARTHAAMPETRLPPAAMLTMVLLCLCWALNILAMKLAAESIPPLLQGAIRSVGAAALGIAWCRLRGVDLGAGLRHGRLRPGVLTGVVFGLEFGAFYLGVTLTSAARAVLFLYAAPFFMALGAHLFLHDDRLSARQVVGLSVAFGGLALGLADGLAEPAGPYALLGDMLCLLAAVGWAATTLMVRGSALRTGAPEVAMLYQLVISVPVLFAMSWALGEAWPAAPTAFALGSLVYQTVVVAFASYIAWFWLVQRHPASLLSAFTFLTPLFGAAAAALLLGEALSPMFLAALALVSVGIAVVNSGQARTVSRDNENPS